LRESGGGKRQQQTKCGEVSPCQWGRM